MSRSPRLWVSRMGRVRTVADPMRMVPTLLALLSVVGCGDSAAPAPTSVPYRPGSKAVRLPRCAGHVRALALPRSFPTSFPIPPGAAVTQIQHELGGFTVILGVASGTFAHQWRFFQRSPPEAGFKLLRQDSEPPKEADGTFLGNHVFGRWKVVRFPGCPAATYFLVATRSTGPVH